MQHLIKGLLSLGVLKQFCTDLFDLFNADISDVMVIHINQQIPQSTEFDLQRREIVIRTMNLDLIIDVLKVFFNLLSDKQVLGWCWVTLLFEVDVSYNYGKLSILELFLAEVVLN